MGNVLVMGEEVSLEKGPRNSQRKEGMTLITSGDLNLCDEKEFQQEPV